MEVAADEIHVTSDAIVASAEAKEEPISDAVDVTSNAIVASAEAKEEPISDAVDVVDEAPSSPAEFSVQPEQAAGDPQVAAASITTMQHCQYCDVETQSAIADRLLHCLAARCALRKMTVEEAVTKLRETLLPPNSGTKKRSSSSSKERPAEPDLHMLHAALEAAGDVKAKGLAFFASKEELQRRVAACERELSLSFRHSQREALAAELVFAYDTLHHYHCGAVIGCGGGFGGENGDECVPCGEASPRSVQAAERHKVSCIYRPLGCRNEGCVHVHSALHEGRHDAICEYKVVPCPRGGTCAAHLPRMSMQDHLDGPCSMKPVPCPFGHLGCDVPCTQGSLEQHMKESCPQHLAIALRVITAQQSAINELQAAAASQAAAAAAAAGQAMEMNALKVRVAELEGSRDTLVGATKSTAEHVTSLRTSSEKHAKELKKLDDAGSKLRSAHAALEKDVKTDRSKLSNNDERLKKAVENVAAKVGEVDKVQQVLVARANGR